MYSVSLLSILVVAADLICFTLRSILYLRVPARGVANIMIIHSPHKKLLIISYDVLKYC